MNDYVYDKTCISDPKQNNQTIQITEQWLE